MKSERVCWEGWDAVRCVADDCELLVGVSVGPRVLSLRRGKSANLLYQDTVNFRVADWRLYGGHRFTVAPEADESYEPDNAPCLAEARGPELRVAAPTGRNGLRRVLVICAASAGSGFNLRHILENHGELPWRGALWAITCVPHYGSVVAPRINSRLRLWPGLEGTPWQLAPQWIVLTPSGARGKAGWYSEAGWLASLQRDATFVIHCPNPPPVHECVDEGCNLEVFTCPDYVELETLSGEVTIAPGEQSEHLQHWRLLAPGFTPHDWLAIGAQAGCVPAARKDGYAP